MKNHVSQMTTQQTDMENLHRIIYDLRDHVRIGYEYWVQHGDDKPYIKACEAAKATMADLGYNDYVIYMSNDVLQYIIEHRPQLESQKLK